MRRINGRDNECTGRHGRAKSIRHLRRCRFIHDAQLSCAPMTSRFNRSVASFSYTSNPPSRIGRSWHIPGQAHGPTCMARSLRPGSLVASQGASLTSPNTFARAGTHVQVRLRWPMSGACQEPKLFHAGPSCMARRGGPFRSSLQQAQPARFGTTGILETGRQPTTQTAGADQRLNRAGHDCRRRQTSADANRSKLSWLSEKLRQHGGFDKSLHKPL